METNEKNKQQMKESAYRTTTPSDSGSWFNRNGAYVLSFAIIIALGTVVFFLVYQHNKKQEIASLETQNLDLSGQLVTRDSLINDWVSLFDQVEKDLQTIKEKENLLSTMESEGGELSNSKRETILHDIQMLNTLLADNKKKIALLNDKLKASGMKIAGLEKKVAELTLTLEQRNQSIDSLKVSLVEKNFELVQLNTRLTDMEVDVAEKQTTIENQTAELHKAYFISGTYKELKDKGLINKEGGFLWIGRNTELRDNVAASNFTEIDITQLTSIPVNSKKVEMITEHPGNSYELVKDENDLIASIAIKDPNEFWRISKYAVIETSK